MRFDREKENAQLFVSRRRRSVLKTKKAQIAFLRSEFDNTNTSLSAKWFQPQSNKIKKRTRFHSTEREMTEIAALSLFFFYLTLLFPPLH